MLSGTAWAQDTESTEETVTATFEASTSTDKPEHMYKIRSLNTTDTGYTMYWDIAGGNDEESCAGTFAFFKKEGTEDQYYIYCVDNKTYLSYKTGATINREQSESVQTTGEAHCWKISAISGTQYFEVIATEATGSDTYYANWNGGIKANVMPHTCMGFWKQNGTADAGSKWAFDEVADIPERVTITYNATLDDGSNLLTKEVSVKKGSPYPAYKVKYSVLNTSGYSSGYFIEVPSGFVSENKTVDIAVSKTPFKISTSYADATWYTLSLGSDKYKLNYDESATQISLSTTTTEWTDKDLFCFVGNVTDGFRIYNKAAGENKLLSSIKDVTESNEATAYVYMVDKTTAESQAYLWDVTQSSHISGVKGFFLSQHGTSSAKMNNRNKILAYWTTNTDQGSTFTVEGVNDDVAVDEIKAFYDKNGTPGYPKSNIDVTTKLGEAINALSASDVSTYVTLRKAYDNCLASTDIVVPEKGKFYTLKEMTQCRYIMSTSSSNTTYSTRLATSEKYTPSADCIFYYDGQYMMGYNDGYYVANSNNFLGRAAVGSTTGTVFSFGSAKVSEGSLYVNFNNNGRGLYGKQDGYVDAASASSTADGYRFCVTEVTSLPLTIGSNGWSSFSAPVAVCKPTNVKVYYAPTAPAEGKLVLTELTGDVIPASTGVLVSGTAGEVVNFSTETGEASATALSDNKLVCNWYVNTVGNSDETTAKTDGKYAFATKTTNGVKTTGFMKLLTEITLPGHKCYLNTATAAAPSSASAQFIPISLTDDPTGIESAETTTASDANAPIYDLQGRKVNGTKKGGMYIQNGKVFIAM